jgi:hypothetical protein
MADLRNAFDLRTQGVTPQDLENYNAQNMGSLRRGFNSGVIGTDANAAAADVLSLRAAGQHAEADAMAQQLAALQQRQGMYAPEVGRVEDVRSLGDFGSYALSNVGQLGASMMDPMAIATGANVLSKGLGLVPHPIAQAASKGLALAGPLLAYGVNSRQLKGELAQDMLRDPAIMANHSAGELNTAANLYGGAAGALDTVFPSIVGRQIAGKTGLGKLGAKSFGGKFLAGNSVEAGTELAQEAGSKAVQSQLNPNRDTSGDNSDYLNTVAGTFLGAAPHSAVGALAERGHERLSGKLDTLGKKAGDTADLATGAVTEGAEKAKGLFGKALGLFRKGGKGDAGSDLSEGADGPDGGTPGGSGFTLDADQRGLLMGDVGVAPHDPGYDDAASEHFQQRDQLVAGLLKEHAATDPGAAALLDKAKAASGDPAQQGAVLDEAANHFLRQADLNDLKSQGDTLNVLGQAAGAIGKRAASAAVKGVGSLVKGVVAGASKKNMQGADDASAVHMYAADVAKKLHDSPDAHAIAGHMAEQVGKAMKQGTITPQQADRLAHHMHTIFGGETRDVLVRSRC